MRKTWIGFGAVAGTAAVVAAVPYFIDWNWFKPQLVTAVEEATGYDVEVAGNIGFSLLPSPRLSAEGVTVTGFGPSREPLVKAEKLSAAVAFLPLLSKRAEVKYIALETPVVRIINYADGTNNWSDPAKVDTGSSGGELSIEDFRIEKGTFIMQSPEGEPTRVDDIDMNVAIASAAGPYTVEGSLRYGAMPVTLKADYEQGGLKLDATLAEAGTIAFAGRIGEAEGDAATPVSGRLTLSGEKLGDLLAAFSGEDASKALAYAKPFAFKAAIEGTTERLRFADVSGTVAGSNFGGAFDVERGDRTSISGRVVVDALNAAEWMSAEKKDEDKEPFELPETIDADVLVRVNDARYDTMQLGAVNAPVKLANRVVTLGDTRLELAGGGSAVVRGILDAADGEPRFRGRFGTSLPRPAQTLAAFGTDGYTSLPPATLGGTIEYRDDAVTLGDLRGTLDGKAVGGKVHYPLEETLPIDVTLGLQGLNWDRVVSKPSTAAKSGDGFARTVNFDVRLGELLMGGSRYGGITAKGNYAADKVTLAQAMVQEAMGFGVTAKGSIDKLSTDRQADLALGLAGEGVKGAINVKGPMSKLDVGGAVTYAGAEIGLNGWVRTDPDVAYQLAASAKAPEAGVVLARLQDEPRGAKLGPLDLGMQIAGAGDVAKITGLAGKIGGMTLSGEASVNTGGSVPVVNAVLNAGVVPVLALMGDDGTGAAEAASGKGARWSSEPLSFDWIRNFDGRIALTAERANYDAYVLEKPSLALTNKGGVMTIEGLKGQLYGGTFTASGALASGDAQGIALKVALSGVPVEPFLKAAMASAPATGTFDMTANVTARGRSQKALMSSLAGPVRLAATNGVIRKVNLKALDEELDDLRSLDSFVRFAGTALKGGETQYRTLAIDATGKGGRFNIDTVTSDMDGGSVTAKGYVDIGAWYADSVATFRLGSHKDAPAIPATIKGPLPVPEVKYSLGPLQTWFGKRIALVGINAAVGGDKLDLGSLIGGKKTQTPAVAEGEAPAEAAPQKSVEEELGTALGKGLGKLFGKKKPAEEPQE
ncbi:AsmA family protein [Sphingosinicella microcystinivorans]|uniref:Cell envelope biogenesis protein AsmA n=2 Tax=Sphingosinicella microcystinivorans TaxID=335406 RepID=A0AAD1G1Y0_SPHMI|nr:AsmA family protein [Sphingosinicella microcystinivorans]RKS86584.1 uncharacterized protein involved in outer membrane biogenesis [Sphingosinicella microcystinivorans]BBE35308.1 cell envelope biogenesis protein AsmA [Sphingosinicella microcystinivorans]